MIKTYRLALSIGGVVFVEADRHEVEGDMIRFYRGDVVCAEYAQTSVKDLSVPTITQRIGLFRRSEKERP